MEWHLGIEMVGSFLSKQSNLTWASLTSRSSKAGHDRRNCIALLPLANYHQHSISCPYAQAQTLSAIAVDAPNYCPKENKRGRYFPMPSTTSLLSNICCSSRRWGGWSTLTIVREMIHPAFNEATIGIIWKPVFAQWMWIFSLLRQIALIESHLVTL